MPTIQTGRANNRERPVYLIPKDANHRHRRIIIHSCTNGMITSLATLHPLLTRLAAKIRRETILRRDQSLQHKETTS